MDEDGGAVEGAYSPSPSSVAQSPRSEVSPDPTAQAAGHDSAAQQLIEFEAADDYIYDLMKIFARATRAMTRYECNEVIQELETLPEEQQKSASVMILVGRAHYEMVEYTKVCS